MEENIIRTVELLKSELWWKILSILWNQVGRSYGGEYYLSCRTRQVGAMEENIVPHLELGRSEPQRRILSLIQNQVGQSYGGEHCPYCRTRQVGAMELWRRLLSVLQNQVGQSYGEEYYPSCRTRQDGTMVENIICPAELGYRSMLQLSATKPTLPVKGIYVSQNVQNSFLRNPCFYTEY